MPEKSASSILKQVCDDILTTQKYIDTSKELSASFELIDFENRDESDKIIEKTKVLISEFKEKIISLDEYFCKHYSLWKNDNSFETDKTNNESAEHTMLNESDIVDDSFCKESENVNNIAVENSENEEILQNNNVINNITNDREESIEENTKSLNDENIKDTENCDDKSTRKVSKEESQKESKKTKRKIIESKTHKSKNDKHESDSDLNKETESENIENDENVNSRDGVDILMSDSNNKSSSKNTEKENSIDNTDDACVLISDSNDKSSSKNTEKENSIENIDAACVSISDSNDKSSSKNTEKENSIDNIDAACVSISDLKDKSLSKNTEKENSNDNTDDVCVSISDSKDKSSKNIENSNDNTDVAHVSISDLNNEQSENIEKKPTDNENSDDAIDPLSIDVSCDNENTNDSTTANEEIEVSKPAEPIKIEFKIKCVDINKLLDPDAVTSTPIHNTNNANTSVVVISDSDNENSILSKKIRKCFNEEVTNTKKNKKSDNRKKIIILDDSDSDSPENIKKKLAKNKELSVIRLTDTNSKRNKNTEPPPPPAIGSRRSIRTRKKIHEDLVNVSSLSENSDSTNVDSDIETTVKKSKTKNKSKYKDSIVKALSLVKDKKFSWKAYIPLTRIAAKTLVQNYQKKTQNKEIRRLANIESLKRSRRNSNASDSSASSDVTEKKRQCTEANKLKQSKENDQETNISTNNSKPLKKSPEKSTKSKDDEESDKSGNDSDNIFPNKPSNTSCNFDDLLTDTSEKNPKKSETEIAEILLGNINSDDTNSKSDEEKAKSSDDEEKQKKSKTKTKEQKEKKSEDKTKEKSSDESGSDEEANRKRKNWRNDKLLTENISESDSEEDFARYMKKKEKQAEKKRLTKRKAKNVLGSDSDQSYASTKNNSDSSSDTSRSSSEEESEKDDDGKKKKSRKRIKRIKDSSDEEGADGDKTTRKNIRKVLRKDDLSESTIAAEKEEEQRKKRLAEKQKKYNLIFDSDSLEKANVDKVVLDFNDETNEEILKVDPEIVKHLKPHQAKGIQFMWNACFESLERSKDTKGSGCILAHCMGLGKTLQVIALVHTLIANEEETGVRKVLVVCPLSTVLNWVAEFKKWLPDDDKVEVFELVSSKQNIERLCQVKEWERVGGALVMGYDMFRNLTNPQNKRLNKKMRATFHNTLVDPGPQLVVCDEGHLLKNEKTSLSIAMNRLKSLRRIVLTGTPLQNNLKEYFCMVQFVKPSLLGTYKEYLNRFVNPITNGQYTDSTQLDIQIMRKRSHVLHKMLDAVVERRDYSVLAPFLPPKHEYVLFVSLTEMQIKLYQHYMRERSGPIANSGKGKGYLFVDFNEFQRICTHPRVLMDKSNQLKLSRDRKDILDDESEGSLKDFIDDDEEEAKSTSSKSGSGSDSDSGSDGSHKNKKSNQPPQRLTRATAATYEISDTEAAVEVQEDDPSEWWKQYCQDDDLDNIAHSGKLSLLFEILKQCEAIGDKVLIFSQSLYSLNVIEYFLNKIDEATQNGETFCNYNGSWALGLDYFRLDGSSSCDNRAAWCKTFNNPENIRARLFLISTRAGGLGINLVAANRVIIFDVSWNPSHDTQSIYRVYRFGQNKPSYIYRFVTFGTMEMKIYERQVTKQAISKRVIDEQQIDRHYNQSDLAELYKFEPTPEEERPIPLVPKDVLLGELLQADKTIYKYHEHQSLLENKVDEVLDEEERKAAWEEFENEKKARMYSGTTNNIPNQSLIIALQSIIRLEHQDWDNSAITSESVKMFNALQEEITETGTSQIFQKAVKQIRLQQLTQQQSMEDYYKFIRQQQQQQLLMQQYRQQIYNQQGGNPYFNNQLANRLASNQHLPMQGRSNMSTIPQTSRVNQNPVEYIDLND